MIVSVYYNEHDAGKAAWLRELIRAGDLPNGDVDERSIEDVGPDELAGYRQCHFFAGIGGWPYALRLAGWPDDRPVWTGSCPCQPFSSAGARRGNDDERNVWGGFYRLIDSERPGIVFGEQSGHSSVIGRAGGVVRATDRPAWLDVVFDDLEGSRYACGAITPAACSVGSPQRRPRTYWMACAAGDGRSQLSETRVHDEREPGNDAARCSAAGESIETDHGWTKPAWLKGHDGLRRPCEPGTEPLVNGLPPELVRGRLAGYGDAIVAPLAAEFVRSAMDVIDAR